MSPTEQLMQEHRTIEAMLDILERMCNRLAGGSDVDPMHLEQAVAFFSIFADRCHHGKEETLLFPEMEKAGFSREEEPLSIMLLEHNAGRRHVKALSQAITRYREASDPSGILRPAREYIALLRDHIVKEDEMLFPMAMERIDESRQDDLLREFNRLEHEVIGYTKGEELSGLLTKLKETYQEPSRTKRTPS